MNKRRIEIFDTTLREGAQMPFVNFSYEQKKIVLRELLLLGVDFAEVGYPASSHVEMDEIKKLSALTKRPILSALGRCTKDDILLCSRSEVEIIDIDLGVSPYQLDILHLTLSEAFNKAQEIVTIAKSTGKRVKFAALDVFRTPIDITIRLYTIVSKAGAEWFTLCDTVGVADPEKVTHTVSKLNQHRRCKLSVHFHNDFDLATANAIAAVKAGVEQVEVTANGIGDRAGISPMAPVLVYLQEIAGFQSSVNLQKLQKFSKLISKMTNVQISPIDPIVGEYCFKHAPGIHGAGVLKTPLSFEPIDPRKVGQTRDFVLGRYTGRHVVDRFYKDIGINLNSEQLVKATDEIKLLSRKKKRITKRDLLTIAEKPHLQNLTYD